MLDITLLRKESDKVKEGLKKKNSDPSLVDRFLEIDNEWRLAVNALETLQARKNQLGSDDREEARKLKEEAKIYEEKISILDKERFVILEHIPNIPAEDVPVGKDETENVVLRTVGSIKNFGFEPKNYLELAGNLISTERAAKTTGSRFGYLYGDLVLLEFALVQFAFEKLLPHGFIPVVPPVMIRPEVMRGMGKVTFVEDGDAFYISEDDLYLVGSAEHTIGPMYMDEILSDENLPLRHIGFSTSFRREAGSYGKDTRGILRVHQFDKLEMFSFTSPEQSEEEHKFLLARQEEFMQSLRLPYQVVQICTGDMGFTDYKQYDVETWLPGQGKYRETNSCSNTTDYQARGVNVRYRLSHEGKPEYVHMLNATGFAIGRAIIAILENYQTEGGDVLVPEVLKKYVGKDKINRL